MNKQQYVGINVKLPMETIKNLDYILEKYGLKNKRGAQRDLIDKLVVRRLVALKESGTFVPDELLEDVDFTACGLTKE